jgi:amicyanin
MRCVVWPLLATVALSSLAAQVPLDRSPNLGGTWVPDRGVLQFNFLHRFYVAPSGQDNFVTNFPTFTFAQGLPARLALGVRYSTRAITNESNEFELFGRWQAMSAPRPIVLALTPAYNFAAESFDAEIQADFTTGRLTLSGAGRVMTKAFGRDTVRLALGGGAVLRLNRYVGVGADYASLLDSRGAEDPAWSAGLLLGIPGSPHLLSLQVSNVDVNTIEGSSLGNHYQPFFQTTKPLIGFEFTIPIHLSRFAAWFSGGESGPPAAGDAAATVRIAQLKFQTDTVTVSVGQTVQWVNDDEVAHTVTFGDPAVASSGNLARGQAFTQRFDRPGAYAYTCTPHPFMRGVVIVR